MRLAPLLALAAALLAAALLADPAPAVENLPPVRVPKLRATAAGPAGFVPKGWRIEALARGDLDGDGRADAVMVLRDTDSRNVVRPFPGDRATRLDTNPRLIAAVLSGGPGRPWRLAAQNARLIPRDEEPAMVDTFDPADGLSAEGGAFRIVLRSFSDAIATASFTFRHEAGRFVLARYVEESRHRFTAAIRTIDIDVAKGEMRIGTGTDGDDETPLAVATKPLPAAARVTLDTIGEAFAFRPAEAAP